MTNLTPNAHRKTKHDPQRQQAKFGSCLLPCTERGLELQASAVPSHDWKLLQSQHLQWKWLICSVTCRSGTSGMPNVKRYRAGF